MYINYARIDSGRVSFGQDNHDCGDTSPSGK